jgi:DNA-binding transcriptional regulator YiaG
MTTMAKRKQRGRPRPEDVHRPDVPYTMKLPDGRTIFVEVPGRFVAQDRDGSPAFLPEGVRFLDRLRALAVRLNRPPSPGYITALRVGLGLTQQELGERLGVDKMTVSRWERGTLHPRADSLAALERLRAEAVRKGVVLPG